MAIPEAEKKKALAWVGVIAVLVALIIAVSWQPSSKNSGVAPMYAPQGQLVPQFPKELILDDAASIASSYSIQYASSTNQYTAQWMSQQSMSALFKKYETYFQSNHWTFSINKTMSLDLRGISASNDKGSVLVTIVAQPKGSKVTVTYVSK